MAINHWSEEQIQEFLDGESSISKSLFEDHLKTCPVCRKSFQYYQNLYRGLKQDPKFQLSANFAQALVSGFLNLHQPQPDSNFPISSSEVWELRLCWEP